MEIPNPETEGPIQPQPGGPEAPDTPDGPQAPETPDGPTAPDTPDGPEAPDPGPTEVPTEPEGEPPAAS